jgi:hypothetical protein
MSAHMSHSGMAAAGCCSSSCQRVTACRILVGRSSRRPARRQPSFSVDQRALTLTGRARRPDRLLGSHPLIDLTGTACCGWPGRPARPAQCRSGPLLGPSLSWSAKSACDCVSSLLMRAVPVGRRRLRVDHVPSTWLERRRSARALGRGRVVLETVGLGSWRGLVAAAA